MAFLTLTGPSSSRVASRTPPKRPNTRLLRKGPLTNVDIEGVQEENVEKIDGMDVLPEPPQACLDRSSQEL